MTTVDSMDSVWFKRLHDLIETGEKVFPRRMETLEIPQATLVVDATRPVLTVPARKMNYRFMAAEALWMITGRDDVEGVAEYNPHIAKFSDDGKTFWGAYGPRIKDQLDYVVGKLSSDKDTRQATLTTWRPNPVETKDVPCTVAFDFKIRKDKLNVHVFMRSSDVWLGVPYDVFNFCAIGWLVCCRLNGSVGLPLISPGKLYLTAASSHLYKTNYEQAHEVLETGYGTNHQAPVWNDLYRDENSLIATLEILRDSKKGDEMRWWER